VNAHVAAQPWERTQKYVHEPFCVALCFAALSCEDGISLLGTARSTACWSTLGSGSYPVR
jgi:hypothetical protein